MSLWGAAVAGIVALILIGAIAGMVHVHDNGVRTKALAPWKPLIDKCPDTGIIFKDSNAAACAQQWSDAVNKNVTLQADVAKNAAETQECNTKVAGLQKDSDGMKAGKAQAAAANKGKIDAANQRTRTLEQELARIKADKGNVVVSCPRAVAKAGSLVLPIASDRVRDFSPESRAASKSGATPAPVDPGNLPVFSGK